MPQGSITFWNGRNGHGNYIGKESGFPAYYTDAVISIAAQINTLKTIFDWSKLKTFHLYDLSLYGKNQKEGIFPNGKNAIDVVIDMQAGDAGKVLVRLLNDLKEKEEQENKLENQVLRIGEAIYKEYGLRVDRISYYPAEYTREQGLTEELAVVSTLQSAISTLPADNPAGYNMLQLGARKLQRKPIPTARDMLDGLYFDFHLVPSSRCLVQAETIEYHCSTSKPSIADIQKHLQLYWEEAQINLKTRGVRKAREATEGKFAALEVRISALAAKLESVNGTGLYERTQGIEKILSALEGADLTSFDLRYKKFDLAATVDPDTNCNADNIQLSLDMTSRDIERTVAEAFRKERELNTLRTVVHSKLSICFNYTYDSRQS